MTEGGESQRNQGTSGDVSRDDKPTNTTGTPAVSGDEQEKSQTSQPAPKDDVGVPDEVGD